MTVIISTVGICLDIIRANFSLSLSNDMVTDRNPAEKKMLTCHFKRDDENCNPELP